MKLNVPRVHLNVIRSEADTKGVDIGRTEADVKP